ncbi:hypothetical protein FQN49_006899, partial [Arthroderma sp. PD_2]
MPASATTSLEVDKREADRKATPYLEPEKGKQNDEFNEQSTRTSSTVEAEIEKEKLDADNGGIATGEEAVAEIALQDSEDYPSGVKLGFIVVA